MRLGLYALLRPLPRADDWAYLIDHTVQIGTVKCFAVVGLRLSEWPARCLRHDDLCLVAPVPMEHSTATTVQRVLEQAERRTGAPRLIVSDQGGDVLGGIDRYCRDHRRHGVHLRRGAQGSESAPAFAGSRCALGRLRGPSRADQGEVAADPAGVLHRAAVRRVGAVHEPGGAIAVGAVVPAAALLIAARRAHR